MAVQLQYAFNESSGTTFAEASGGPSGTVQSGGSFVAGNTGNALVTSNNFAAGIVTGSPLLATTNWTGLTVMCWFKVNIAGDNLALWDGTYNWFGIGFNAATNIKTWLDVGAFSETSPYTHGVGVGSWFHCAATWSAATDVLSLFVNGVSAATIGLGGTTIGRPTSELNIGGATWASSANAAVDDLRIFDTALTGSEITTQMNTPVGAPAAAVPPSLVMAQRAWN